VWPSIVAKELSKELSKELLMMKVHNYLPLFVECIQRWKTPPSWSEFSEQYFSEMGSLRLRFGGEDIYESLMELDWESYRQRVLKLDPVQVFDRFETQLRGVQNLFKLPMEGEVTIWGSFETMDGYARFDQARHHVFLGVDESFDKGSYLDILMAHELTHVVRESRPEVWDGFGLKLNMSNDEFTESQPVIEHLFSEGFSCAVSELLVPSNEPWHYAYQDQENIAYLIEKHQGLDQRIHAEIRKDAPDAQNKRHGDYSSLYWASRYVPQMPSYAHYMWAWQWVKRLLKDLADGDPTKLVSVCSEEWVEHALGFKMDRVTF
jgi:hypothetical protein